MELTDREVKKIASLYNKLVRIGKYSKLSGEELRSKVGEKVVARENDYGEDEFYARNFDEPFADETYVRYKPKTLEKIDKEYKPKKQAKKAQKQEQAKQVVKGVAVKEKKLKKKELKPSIFDIPPVIEESSFQVKKLKVPSQLNVEPYSPELDEEAKSFMEDMVQKSQKVLEKIEKLVETAPEEVDDSQKIVDEYNRAKKTYENYKGSIPRTSKDKKKQARLEELKSELDRASVGYDKIRQEAREVESLFDKIEYSNKRILDRIEYMETLKAKNDCIFKYLKDNFKEVISEIYDSELIKRIFHKAVRNLGINYTGYRNGEKYTTEPLSGYYDNEYTKQKEIMRENLNLNLTEEEMNKKIQNEMTKIAPNMKKEFLNEFLEKNGGIFIPQKGHSMAYLIGLNLNRAIKNICPDVPKEYLQKGPYFDYYNSLSLEIQDYIKNNKESIERILKAMKPGLKLSDILQPWSERTNSYLAYSKMSKEELQKIVNSQAVKDELEKMIKYKRTSSNEYKLVESVKKFAAKPTTQGMKSVISFLLKLNKFYGGGFWGDFAKGFKQGFMGTLGVAKDILPFVI